MLNAGFLLTCSSSATTVFNVEMNPHAIMPKESLRWQIQRCAVVATPRHIFL